MGNGYYIRGCVIDLNFVWTGGDAGEVFEVWAYQDLNGNGQYDQGESFSPRSHHVTADGGGGNGVIPEPSTAFIAGRRGYGPIMAPEKETSLIPSSCHC